MALSCAPASRTSTYTAAVCAAAAPCALATARGLAIGAPRETVLTLYAGLINPEWDEEASGSILIGTIFGGIMIGIENGLVSSLFIGAMAE